MTVLDLPPLTGSPIVDPWRIRHRLELAGELQIPQVERSPAVTRSEQVLWELLEHEPPGWQREYSTGLYRLDFYCPTARLAIEVDGGSHYGREAGQRDALRDQWHRARGITTKRFSAREVEQAPTWVLDEIGQLLGIKEANQDDVVDEEVEGRSVADSSAADGILEEAQDLEEQPHDRGLQRRRGQPGCGRPGRGRRR